MSCTNCKKQSTFSTAKKVVTGAINLVSSDPEIEELAAKRLSKCAVCPHSKELIRVADNSIIQCGLCKCLTQLKARVKEESCPLELW